VAHHVALEEMDAAAAGQRERTHDQGRHRSNVRR
jgi:hypothetical protein